MNHIPNADEARRRVDEHLAVADQRRRVRLARAHQLVKRAEQDALRARLAIARAL